MTKLILFKYSTHQGEQLFLKQFSLKTTLKGCKLLIFVKIAKKTSFWAKNDVIRRKCDVTRQNFFSKYSTRQGEQLFPNSFA